MSATVTLAGGLLAADTRVTPVAAPAGRVPLADAGETPWSPAKSVAPPSS